MHAVYDFNINVRRKHYTDIVIGSDNTEIMKKTELMVTIIVIIIAVVIITIFFPDYCNFLTLIMNLSQLLRYYKFMYGRQSFVTLAKKIDIP